MDPSIMPQKCGKSHSAYTSRIDRPAYKYACIRSTTKRAWPKDAYFLATLYGNYQLDAKEVLDIPSAMVMSQEPMLTYNKAPISA